MQKRPIGRPPKKYNHDFAKKLGRDLRRRRNLLGYSAAVIAQTIFYSPSTLRSIERGFTNPDAKSFCDYSQFIKNCENNALDDETALRLFDNHSKYIEHFASTYKVQELRELRLFKGITRREIADRLGCSLALISGYELGRVRMTIKRYRIVLDFLSQQERRSI